MRHDCWDSIPNEGIMSWVIIRELISFLSFSQWYRAFSLAATHSRQCISPIFPLVSLIRASKFAWWASRRCRRPTQFNIMIFHHGLYIRWWAIWYTRRHLCRRLYVAECELPHFDFDADYLIFQSWPHFDSSSLCILFWFAVRWFHTPCASGCFCPRAPPSGRALITLRWSITLLMSATCRCHYKAPPPLPSGQASAPHTWWVIFDIYISWLHVALRWWWHDIARHSRRCRFAILWLTLTRFAHMTMYFLS